MYDNRVAAVYEIPALFQALCWAALKVSLHLINSANTILSRAVWEAKVGCWEGFWDVAGVGPLPKDQQMFCCTLDSAPDEGRRVESREFWNEKKK
jgi:hypothetical protein